MPWFEEDASAAWKRLARNKFGKWPGRSSAGSRLEPIAKPNFTAPFSITTQDKIFTIGSCFARNIEKSFLDLGFDVPARRFSVPALEVDESGQGDPSSILNKYSPFSMEQEVAFALSKDPGFSDHDCLVGVDETHVYDMQLAIGKPVTERRGLERRAEVKDLYQLIRECRIVFLTLGLVETWFDKKVGIHLNRPVPPAVASRHKGRFVFQVADFDSVRASTLRLIDLLQSSLPHDGKIILTVSPVPLNSTFSPNDVLIANSYSKAALRVAAEEAVARKDEVYYYPSFESVTMSSSREAWYDDLRHVRDELVRYNTGRFIALVSDGALDIDTKFSMVEASIVAGNNDSAFQELESICGQHPDRVDLKFRLADLYVAHRHHREAIPLLDDVLSIKPLDREALMLRGRAAFAVEDWAAAVNYFSKAAARGDKNAHYWKGRAQGALGDISSALESFVGVDPKASTYVDACYQLGVFLITLGHFDLALAELERVVAARPSHSGGYARLAEANLALGNLDIAETCAVTALSLQKDFWFAHYILGLVYTAKDEVAKARESFLAAKSLREDPRIEAAIENLRV